MEVRPHAVLKVGGSLSKGPDLVSLCREIDRLGARRRLLVVPGGGAFADQVRDHDRRYGLSATTAHRMALLAMDQYGCLLGDLLPGASLVVDLLSAGLVLSDGRVPILLPAALLNQADPLPHSWEVTSDTIAAWIAQLSGAPRLILLKSVDGLVSADAAQGAQANLISHLSVESLADHQGVVDTYLHNLLARMELETWIINGRTPQRLARLLQSGDTLGTRIG
jgi:5-(aminomethyl)-3-furanmethanol phosphate kinase